MNTQTALNLAIELMDKHGLYARGWQFEWSRATLQFGLCSHRRKLITLSRKLVEVNDETQVRDTILHEIAHALCGPGEGHGTMWKLKAREIGAKPERCYSTKDTNVPETRYHGICRDCGRKVPRVKRPRRSMLISGYHTKCRYKANKGKIDWFCEGVRMIGLVELLESQPALQAAACKPAPEIKQEPTQSEISAMWERLNRIEAKL